MSYRLPVAGSSALRPAAPRAHSCLWPSSSAGLRVELVSCSPGRGCRRPRDVRVRPGHDRVEFVLLAYTLGIAAALLAASNSRQTVVRAEQAELLLAQTQRSHEEQLRAARLEESTRIAREIHDVLAHTLAGLTIQLEATGLVDRAGR